MFTEKLRFASLNVRGLNDRNKRLLTFDIFKNSNYDFVLLQETKTVLQNEKDYNKFFTNRKLLWWMYGFI